ncbi:WW domain-containing oxidoreductase [Trichinella pseudospiralis]|uniref:WW domain-containing oxidoreductase n=1 Tax=Trichinella pseudospiralis TaxID=6337 RepID=A0A0V0XKP2_TRIPS|nr:WW domain-containing oxidoreductase [Trichinella pseudospiralis]
MNKTMEYERVILITGSTDGIGRETAKQLAKNPKNMVIVHGRSLARCEDTVKMILAEHQDAKVEHVVYDFNNMSNIPKMADEIKNRFPKLNTIICNAGVLLPERTLSDDGLELTFQVNHLAHFALVCLLLDTLKNNAPSRLIIVSSLCYNWFSIDWDDLMGETDYEKYKQYSRTKLMNHMFTFALARRLITGARTAVYLVESQEVSNISGEYFDRRQNKIEAESESRLESSQEKLWDVSVDMCKKFSITI